MSIAGAFRLCESLKFLSLLSCSLTRHSSSIVADIIKVVTCEFCHHNCLTECRYVSRCSALWTSSLRDDLIEHQEALISQSNLPVNSGSLEKICLSCNNLGDAGVITLCERLKEPFGVHGN